MAIVPDGMPTVAPAFDAAQTQAENAAPAVALVSAGVPGAHALNTRLAHWNVQQHALEQLQRDRILARGGER